MNKKAITKLQAVVIGAIIVIAALAVSVYYIFTKPAEKTEIVFGSTCALSGAEIGISKPIWVGQKVAIDEINAKGGIYVPELGKRLPVRWIYYDDENDASKAALYYERLITVEKVDFVLSCFNDANLLAVISICEKYGYPIICTGAISPEIPKRGLKYVFDYFASAEHMPLVFIDFLDYIRKNVPQNIAPKTIAIMATNDDLKYCGRSAKEYAEKLGFEVVYYVEYADPGTDDFTPFIQEMKARNPDVIANMGHALDSVKLVRQLVEQGLSPKLWASSIGFYDPAFREALGVYANETYSSTGWGQVTTPTEKAAMDDIIARARQIYEPAGDDVLAPYTGVMILKEAIEAVGLDRDKVRDYIATHEFHFAWVGETVKFNEMQWYPVKSEAVGILINGEQKLVYPTAVAEVPIVYPMTPWNKRG
jgi:branched-chain amino acid transport system substrate-binding protein